LIGASQAHFLRGVACAPALAATYERLAALVPPVLVDRPLGPDIERLRAVLGVKRAELP
jgi:histidine ammonia-lyase